MAKLDDYLTIQKCADQLGCDPATVWRWVKAGRLKSVAKFGRTLIHRRDCRRPKLDNRGSSLFGRKKMVTDNIEIGATYTLPENFACVAKSPDGTRYNIWIIGKPNVIAHCAEDGELYFTRCNDEHGVRLYCSSVKGIKEAKHA